MPKNFLENTVVSSQEQMTERAIPEREKLLDAVSETLHKVQAIQSIDIETFSPDFIMEGISERLNADAAQRERAAAEVHFSERAEVLHEKQRGIKEKFEASVRKAMLPVVTAFAMNWSTAVAQETTGEQPVATPEVSKVAVKTEIRKWKEEDVLDRNSPLEQSSEMKKTFERSITSEELATLEELRQEAWQGKNEVASYGGRDRDGRYLIQKHVSGPTGGRVELEEAEDMVSDRVFSHTHPVEASSEFFGISALDIREGKRRAGIMPPSAVDIGQCIENASENILQRVVDPRGVWEYECDADHPFSRLKMKLNEDFVEAFKNIEIHYGVDAADFAEAVRSTQDIHPVFMLARTFSALESKYPGIEKSVQDTLEKIVKSHMAFGLALLEYEQEGSRLAMSSSEDSDQENAKKISEFIKKAEKIGVWLSYTPFKEQLFRAETVKSVSVVGSATRVPEEEKEREAKK